MTEVCSFGCQVDVNNYHCCLAIIRCGFGVPGTTCSLKSLCRCRVNSGYQDQQHQLIDDHPIDQNMVRVFKNVNKSSYFHWQQCYLQYIYVYELNGIVLCDDLFPLIQFEVKFVCLNKNQSEYFHHGSVTTTCGHFMFIHF